MAVNFDNAIEIIDQLSKHNIVLLDKINQLEEELNIALRVDNNVNVKSSKVSIPNKRIREIIRS